jgi:hypothetical protein
VVKKKRTREGAELWTVLLEEGQLDIVLAYVSAWWNSFSSDTHTVICLHRTFRRRVLWECSSTAFYILVCIAKSFAKGFAFVPETCWYYSRLNKIPFYQHLNSSDDNLSDFLSISWVCIFERDQNAMSSEPSGSRGTGRSGLESPLVRTSGNGDRSLFCRAL